MLSNASILSINISKEVLMRFLASFIALFILFIVVLVIPTTYAEEQLQNQPMFLDFHYGSSAYICGKMLTMEDDFTFKSEIKCVKLHD
jgi:hypothetical protein